MQRYKKYLKGANKNAKKCRKKRKKVRIICIYAKFFVTLSRKTWLVNELNEINESKNEINESKNEINESKYQGYETCILTIDCRSGKCIVRNDTRAKCNGAASAEYKH